MDWVAFELLVEDTVSRLRVAAGSCAKVRAAIRHYINRGDALGMSPMILWDYFAISSPGIPERAGYDEADRKSAVGVFEELSAAKFRPSS
jgi:hypothetical protein